MSKNLGWILTLKKEPSSRLDLSIMIPQKIINCSSDQICEFKIFDGNLNINFGDFFNVTPLKSKDLLDVSKYNKKILGITLVFKGDLSKVDFIGAKMNVGKILVYGDVGDYLGFSLSGGYIEVRGSAGIHAGCEMSGGIIKVLRNVGDFGASALPGKLQGMTGGVFLVKGNVGDNFANAMRRGFAIISGDSGRYLASKMVAGTIVIAGKTRSHCGFGMKRGTIIFSHSKPNIPSTFVPANYNFNSFWGVMASDLENYDGMFADIARKNFLRVVGDLGFGGKGEWLYVEE